MQVNALIVIVGAILAATSAADPLSEVCLFNLNEDALNQCIENQVKAILADEPVVRIISIARDATGNFLNLNGNGVTARISLANPAQADTSANNLLAYIPSYVGDFHASGLGTVFINLDDLFPCLQGRDPTCFRATAEEDGLNKGQDILEAADGGNNLLVWGAGVQRYTYAFAIQGCAELSVECLPTFYAFSVVCLLPREQCG